MTKAWQVLKWEFRGVFYHHGTVYDCQKSDLSSEEMKLRRKVNETGKER
jgi:hypothetical protein